VLVYIVENPVFIPVIRYEDLVSKNWSGQSEPCGDGVPGHALEFFVALQMEKTISDPIEV
jgi:hypothetical protein